MAERIERLEEPIYEVTTNSVVTNEPFMNILGVNAFHGDSSAALLVDGQLVAAVEEERFNRIKHWAGLPVLASTACLREAATTQVDHIAVSRDPAANVGRKLLRAAVRPTAWSRMLSRAANSVHLARLNESLFAAGIGTRGTTHFHHVEHHRAHMASAFFASPFSEAAVVSIDGFGDFSSVMWGVGNDNHFDVRGAVRFPHSLGIFYTAFTQYLGFPKYGDEYKMMGLSALGQARFIEQVRDVVRVEGDQIILNLDYFTHHDSGVEMTWEGGEPSLGDVYSQKLVDVFGPPRAYRAKIEERHADVAASVQAVLEEAYFALLRHVQKMTGQTAVCLAGGVALNCAANGKIFGETPFRDVYIQPAAHDAGTSIGAALYVWNEVLGNPRSFVMRHVYYGGAFNAAAIQDALDTPGTRYHQLSEGELIDCTAKEIAAGRTVGWYQGAMEFGPRALGNRSILADPRRADMKDILNSRIKYREPFRPFCPSILADRVGEFFEIDYPSPFMVSAYPIRREQRERVPAITHADGTGRLQTVEADVNPLYWKLIHRFAELTGVPILLNTSFNENEPIVNTPAEAVDCFLRTNMDVLVAGPFLLLKSENVDIAPRNQVVDEAMRA